MTSAVSTPAPADPLDRVRELIWNDPPILETDEELEIIKDVADQTSCPETLELLAQMFDTQERVAGNRATPGDLLHRIITQYELGQEDWTVEVFVGIHPRAMPETLGEIAAGIANFYPDAEQLSKYLIAGTPWAVLDGPVQALIGVLCHISTPEPTRRLVKQRLAQAKIHVGGADNFDEQLVEHVLWMINIHGGRPEGGLWDDTIGWVRDWLETRID